MEFAHGRGEEDPSGDSDGKTVRSLQSYRLEHYPEKKPADPDDSVENGSILAEVIELDIPEK